MNIRVLTLGCLLGLSLPALAIAQSADSDATPANATAEVERITDAGAFLAEIERSLEMARNGEYGKLRRSQMSDLQDARDEIVLLLEGHATATELPPEERIVVYNAQEVMSSILRKDDKERVICEKTVKIGTRLGTTECLTVGQREARARIASESTGNVQRTVCVAGEGNPCQ